MSAPSDRIWKALADATRRAMLDALAGGPLTTGDLVDRFPDLCRTNVMKHLDVLVEANLVVIRREGRVRWNYLNPTPIQRVCDRWVSRHVRHIASAMSRLKDIAQELQSTTSTGVQAKRPKHTGATTHGGSTTQRRARRAV